MQEITLSVTCDSSGAATVNHTCAVLGRLYAIQWTMGTCASGVDLTISTQGGNASKTLLAVTNLSASALYYPRDTLQTTLGADITDSAGLIILDGIPRVVVTDGGNKKIGIVTLFYLDTSISPGMCIAGDKMDLVDAPNSTAVTAIQSGLAATGAKMDLIDAPNETAILKIIDGTTTTGLAGTSNSLAYRVNEIERHLHSYERWYGVAATPSATHKADLLGKDIASFQIDAGNDTWGAWLQLLGSADTAQKYDFHEISITGAERASTVHFVQFAFGATGDAAYSAGTYTTVIYRTGAAQNREAPFQLQTRRQDAGTLAWARVLAYDQDTATLNLYFGLHYYEG